MIYASYFATVPIFRGKKCHNYECWCEDSQNLVCDESYLREE